MATAVQTVERENYLNSNYGIKSWLLTTDHKRIAILYLISITADVLAWRILRHDDSPGTADARW